MQVHCQRCGFVFTMSQAALEAAVEDLKKSPAKHYNVECPKCRRVVKVPAKRFKRLAG